MSVDQPGDEEKRWAIILELGGPVYGACVVCTCRNEEMRRPGLGVGAVPSGLRVSRNLNKFVTFLWILHVSL